MIEGTGRVEQCIPEEAGLDLDWSKCDRNSFAKWVELNCGFAESNCAAEVLWREKLLGLSGFVCSMLCALRDEGYLKLDAEVFFKAIEIESLERFRSIGWLAGKGSEEAASYLRSLPGYEGASLEPSEMSRQAHDHARFGLELPMRKSLGLGFREAKPIAWERIPCSQLELEADKESILLSQSLDKPGRKLRRRL